jgi:hypothetical protein
VADMGDDGQIMRDEQIEKSFCVAVDQQVDHLRLIETSSADTGSRTRSGWPERQRLRNGDTAAAARRRTVR